MVDHQGLERNVRSRKHREMEGFRVIAGWRYTKRYTNHNCVRKEPKMKKVKLTYEEIRVLLLILNEFRNELIEDDRNTDILDDIICKLVSK